MYEAYKLKFLEGWGVIGQIPSMGGGGVWIYSGTTNSMFRFPSAG